MEEKLEKIPFSQHLVKLIAIVKSNWERAAVTQSAAEMAYFVLLSLIPIILLVANVIPLLPIDIGEILHLLQNYLPEDIYGILAPILTQYLSSGSSGVISFALIAAIWSASKVFSTMSRVLDDVYGVQKVKNFVIKRLLSFVIMLAILAMVFVAMFIFVFGEQILIFVKDFLQIDIPFIQEFVIFRFAVLIIASLAYFVILYHFLPDHHLSIKYALPGAVFATIGWLLLSQFFSLYVSMSGGDMLTNATIGGFIVLMIFLYFVNIVTLLGAMVNTIVFQWCQGVSVVDFEADLQKKKEAETSQWNGYPNDKDTVILRRSLHKIKPIYQLEKERKAVKYLANGLYLCETDSGWRIGLSEKGQYELGEVMYIDLPTEQDNLQKGDELLTAEGAKSVSELISPISGQVVKWHTDLEDQPEKLNSKQADDHWIVELTDVTDLEQAEVYDDPWLGQEKPKDA